MDVLSLASQMGNIDLSELKGNGKDYQKDYMKPGGRWAQKENRRAGNSAARDRYNSRIMGRGRGMRGRVRYSPQTREELDPSMGRRRARVRGMQRGYQDRMNRTRVQPRRRYQRRYSERQQDNVYSLLQNMDSNKMDPESMKKVQNIAVMLMTMMRPTKPQTAFQKFFAQEKKNDVMKSFETIREEWTGLEEPDKMAMLEASWNDMQDFNKKLVEYNGKKLEMENEIRVLQGKPVMPSRGQRVKGYDLHWKKVEAKLKASMPGATQFKLDQERKKEWNALSEKEKEVFILESQLEQQKVDHARRMAAINAKIEALKKSLAAPLGVAPKSK